MAPSGTERIQSLLANAAEERREMIRRQIIARGLRDEAVIAAVQSVPRELFVPPDLRSRAYEDCALPLGPGQTISQPFIVAYMTHHLDCTPAARVLEVGGGSGYQACILGRLVQEVHSVELDPALAADAARRAADLNITNVHFHAGDGSRGWPDAAPFDRILVTAACPGTPEPLIEQLAMGGAALMPVGDGDTQTLVRITKSPEGCREQDLIGCRFVKLLGAYGHPA